MPLRDARFIHPMHIQYNPSQLDFSLQFAPVDYNYLLATQRKHGNGVALLLHEFNPDTGDDKCTELEIPPGFNDLWFCSGPVVSKISRMHLDMQSGLVIIKPQRRGDWTRIMSYV
jgi:hypothetical protein